MKKFCILILVLSVFIISVNFVKADSFSEYNDRIISTAANASATGACDNKCSDSTDLTTGVVTKYYQLTTGVPFLGSNAKKCACIPVNSGMQFFLTAILKFILGSIATVATIIIIAAGFMWSFSAGNKGLIEKSKGMIKNAIVGLIMALTCGLMLQVVNPRLLDIKVLKINDITIEPVEYGKVGGLALGKRCNTNESKPCTIGLRCISVKGVLGHEGDSSNTGVCVSSTAKLIGLGEACESTDPTINYCIPPILDNGVTKSAPMACVNKECAYIDYNNASGSINSSVPTVGEGELCGVSNNNAGCNSQNTCLACDSNIDGAKCTRKTPDGNNLFICYPKICKQIVGRGLATSASCQYKDQGICCENGLACAKDNGAWYCQ